MKQGKPLLCLIVAVICGYAVFAAQEVRDDAATTRAGETGEAELPVDRDFPPHVVKTVPANLAKDVDVTLREIRVTFDRPMETERSWSWIIHRPLGAYPGLGRGGPEPRWEDEGRTCILAVRLAPDTVCAIGVNSIRHTGFRDTEAKVAMPHVWAFKTGQRE